MRGAERHRAGPPGWSGVSSGPQPELPYGRINLRSVPERLDQGNQECPLCRAGAAEVLESVIPFGLGYTRVIEFGQKSCYNSRFFRVRTLFGIDMVVIRLARGGAKQRPFFNIVATASRNRRDGRFIERIGFYNPVASGNEESFRIVQDRLTYWQGVGAQLSPTVARLVKQAGQKAAA